jgi:hypothetical protein
MPFSILFATLFLLGVKLWDLFSKLFLNFYLSANFLSPEYPTLSVEKFNYKSQVTGPVFSLDEVKKLAGNTFY